MSNLFTILFLTFHLVLLDTVNANILDFFKGHVKSYDYEFETSENYEFEACQKFNSNKDFEYYLTCRKGKLVKEKEFDLLLSDVRAIESHLIENDFLEALKEDILEELENNRLVVKKQKKCFGLVLKGKDGNLLTDPKSLGQKELKECEEIQASAVNTVKKDVPQMRVLMAQKDMPGHIFSPTRPVRFMKENLVHEINKRTAPDLTKKEIEVLTKNTHVLEKAFKQDILSLNLNKEDALARMDKQGFLDSAIPCSGDIDSERCKTNFQKTEIIEGLENCTYVSDKDVLEIKEDTSCQRFNVMVNHRINNRFEKQNKIYQQEYNRKISGNPLISLVPLTGDENLEETQRGIYSVLEELDQNGASAINHIKTLKGDDRKDLLGFNVAVEKFLKERGPNQIICDVSEELKGDRDFSELKTDLFIGASALVGGGVCAFTAGLGCAAVVAVGVEVGAVTVSQNRFNKASMTFTAGLTDAQTTIDREFERDMSLYLAPLALVGGPGKVILKTANKVVAKPPVKSFPKNVPLSNSRRYDFQKRRSLELIERKTGGATRVSRLFNKYYPGNKFDISQGDKIYISAIAKDLQKDIRGSLIRNGMRPNSKAFKELVRKKTKLVLDSIVEKCTKK